MAHDGALAMRTSPFPSARSGAEETAPSSLERLERTQDSGGGEPVHTVVALQEEGSRYRGSLLRDVVAYREMRFRELAGKVVTGDDIGTLTALEARLRQPRAPVARPRERRHFRRFKCRFAAKLLCLGEDGAEALDVQVVDVGAGGARLVHADRLAAGQAVALVVAMGEGHDGRSPVTFPARVVWSGAGASGIMFAGHPRTSSRKPRSAANSRPAGVD